MNTRRLLQCTSVAGLAGAIALAATASGAGLPPDIRVIDSQAAAAVVGVLTRVPAESDGGAVYSSTSLTLDKAVARAAGFTAGPLAETFLVSSSEEYRNPVLVSAQYPPTETVPAEATFDGAATPEGSPLAGKAGRFHTQATDVPSAVAQATGTGAVGPDVTVDSAASASDGELLGDGTLVTRATSQATGVRIGEVLTLAQVKTVAEARVPRSGDPTTKLAVTMAGVTLAGVPAEVTPEGIRVSDQAPVSPVALAEFNAALAQLEAQGITVLAAPLVEETAAGAARASGGALRIRYHVADQVGGDEEVTLAPATAKSSVSRREAQVPTIEIPELPMDAPPVAGVNAAPAPATPASAAPLPATGAPATASFGTGRTSPRGSSGYASSAYGDTALPSTASLPTSSGSDPGTPEAASAAVPADDLLLTAQRGPDPAQKLRSGYGLVLLALVAAVGSITVLFRIRPA